MKYSVVSRGFTLIELMVVVVVIGILATLSLTNFSQYKIKSKVAEAYTLLAATQKAESAYFVSNLAYRSLEPNPPTILAASTSVLIQDSSWAAIGSPLPVNENSFFGYTAYAGYVDESGSEFVVNTDGSVAAAGAYSFGPHSNAGGDACPSTADTSDVGLSLSPGSSWVVMMATGDLVDDGGNGSCSLIFQTLETRSGSISFSPFVKVNAGE